MKKLVAVLAAVCVLMVGCGAIQADAEQEESKKRFEVVDSEYFYADSYAHILVDRETGVMYFVLDVYKGGGVTVMVDAGGKPLIWEGAE